MKKLWQKNRVLFVLIIILIICFAAIVGVSLTFFYSKDVSEYGTRLDDIEKYPITDSFKTEYKEKLLENEGITKVNITLKGRVLYITVNLEKVELEDAKKIINDSLSLFEEDILSYYDVEFILKSEDYTIIGAKNAVIDHIAWNNNIDVPEEEETSEDEK